MTREARVDIPFQGSTESCKTHLKSALAKIKEAGMSFAAWSAGAFDQADNYELLLSPTNGKDTVGSQTAFSAQLGQTFPVLNLALSPHRTSSRLL